MGLIGTLKNVGKVTGPILGGMLIEWFDFALTLQLMGLMLLLSAALVWFWGQLLGKARGKKIAASV